MVAEGVLIFGPGEQKATLCVQILKDKILDGEESFMVKGGGGGEGRRGGGDIHGGGGGGGMLKGEKGYIVRAAHTRSRPTTTTTTPSDPPSHPPTPTTPQVALSNPAAIADATDTPPSPPVLGLASVARVAIIDDEAPGTFVLRDELVRVFEADGKVSHGAEKRKPGPSPN